MFVAVFLFSRYGICDEYGMWKRKRKKNNNNKFSIWSIVVKVNGINKHSACVYQLISLMHRNESIFETSEQLVNHFHFYILFLAAMFDVWFHVNM